MAEIPQNSFQGPLAPKIGLNEDYKKSIPGGPSNDTGKKRNFGRLIPVGAIALALLVLPLTIDQLNQQQDIQQRASQPTPTIVVPVGGEISPTPVNDLPPPAVFESASESAENN